MSSLVSHVERTIVQRRLLRPRQRVLIAVSGGVDSMVLLRVLHTLSATHGWQLTVGHLNHRLRGRSSDADEALVRRTARKLRIPVVVEAAEVRKFAAQKNLSLEMAARDRRHDFLARTAARLRIRTVALGHQTEDQLELFFLRLLRGSGGEGLAGMKWRSRSPADSRLELVRPLLDVSKQALREFALEEKIAFREDASNSWLDIPRNRVRHELVPLLKKRYQPALETTICRTMEVVGTEAEFITDVAQAWLAASQEPPTQANRRTKRGPKKGAGEWLAKPFDALPVAVQRRCVQLQLFELGMEADFTLVERLRLNPEKLVSAGVGHARFERGWLRREISGKIHLQKPPMEVVATTGQALNLTEKTGQFTYDAVRFGWRIRGKGGFGRGTRSGGCEFFDADRVGQTILLRHWRAGDRFQPIGMPRTVKLQDLFTNLKVPREKRHNLVVATTAQGEVFWVENLRIAERFKLTSSTNRRLQWMWKRL